jgi:hypothetical protein
MAMTIWFGAFRILRFNKFQSSINSSIKFIQELNAISVKVLLFGDCVHHYWKLQPGNTILLNNPQCAEQTNENEGSKINLNELITKFEM